MTDPHAPHGYSFANQKKLDKVLKALQKNAEDLNELSFGDAASEVERTIAKIEHHAEETHWTRLARATHNYIRLNHIELPLPDVGEMHMRTEHALRVSFLVHMGEQTTQDFIKTYDPGNPLDKLCPVCTATPGHPCSGVPIEEVHPQRRYA